MRQMKIKYCLMLSFFTLMVYNFNFVLAVDSAVNNFNKGDLSYTPYSDIYDTPDNKYLHAFNSIHNEDGTPVEGWMETYANDLLYNTASNEYNPLATSTGGKLTGNLVSLYEGYQNGKAIYSNNVTITISGQTPVLAQDGHGTETFVSSSDYVAQVTGYVYDDSGAPVWVQVVVCDSENGCMINAFVPLSAISEGLEIPPEPEPEPEPKALGHISMSSSTQIYSNFTPSLPPTETKVYDDIYDISQGIPTSEYIHVYGKAPKALYFIAVRTTTIKAWCDPVTIQATASYDNWEIVGSHKEPTGKYNKSGDMLYETVYDYGWVERGVGWHTCVENYTDSVQKSYYDVPTSAIYSLKSVTITETNETYSTYKLEKTIGMEGISGPGPQTLKFSLQQPSISAIYQCDDEGNQGKNAESAAISAAKNSSGFAGKAVINSALNSAVDASVSGNVNYHFKGLDVTMTSCSGSPNPEFAEAYGEMLIPETYPNGKYNPDGYFTYEGYGNVHDVPEPVYVHTPVVNHANIISTSPFVNQKIDKDLTKASLNYYLMLDEEFTINIPDRGTHRNIKGYGTRDYNSRQGDERLKYKITTWGKVKDVKLPFDVYVHYGNNGRKHFLKANTWLSESNPPVGLTTTVDSYTFTIPVWVKEQEYTIETRVIAENAIDGVRNCTSNGEETANLNINNYVATKNISVEVIGKIYDLRINASNDYGWTQVYSQKTGKEYITANEFPFGQVGQNRVMQYKYAPKLGYTFVFNFKTKGRKSNNIDISVQPEGFYFVNRSGGTAKAVDLYYDSITQKNIKILPSDSIGSVAVKLTDAFMEVPSQEFVDSNRIYQKEYGKTYNYNLGVKIGNFAEMNLLHSLRLCYNNFTEYINALYGKGSTENSISSNAGSKDNVIGSVGHWWAGYRLPASTIAVNLGEIPKADKSNALTDGYVLVKFDIKTKYKNQIGNYNYLQYMGPEALNVAGDNTAMLTPDWTKGTTQDITLPNGNYAKVPTGSVAIYDASLRSSNDAEIGGTH